MTFYTVAKNKNSCNRNRVILDGACQLECNMAANAWVSVLEVSLFIRAQFYTASGQTHFICLFSLHFS